MQSIVLIRIEIRAEMDAVLYDLFVMGFYYARKCQIIIFHDHLNIPSVIRDVLENEFNHCKTYMITDGQKSSFRIVKGLLWWEAVDRPDADCILSDTMFQTVAAWKKRRDWSDPSVLRYAKMFAEAHGMTDSETAVLFDEYKVVRFIRRNRAGLGHRSDEVVAILHNVIIMNGGDLPELPPEYVE